MQEISGCWLINRWFLLNVEPIISTRENGVIKNLLLLIITISLCNKVQILTWSNVLCCSRWNYQGFANCMSFPSWKTLLCLSWVLFWLRLHQNVITGWCKHSIFVSAHWYVYITVKRITSKILYVIGAGSGLRCLRPAWRVSTPLYNSFQTFVSQKDTFCGVNRATNTNFINFQIPTLSLNSLYVLTKFLRQLQIFKLKEFLYKRINNRVWIFTVLQ